MGLNHTHATEYPTKQSKDVVKDKKELNHHEEYQVNGKENEEIPQNEILTEYPNRSPTPSRISLGKRSNIDINKQEEEGKLTLMESLQHMDRPCEKKYKRTHLNSPSITPKGSNNNILPALAPKEDPVLFSPLDIMPKEYLIKHLSNNYREGFLRPLLPLITKLMFHKYNHGLFNTPVDPIAWNIPHYYNVIKHPMDLSLVKKKCRNLEYESAEACALDIRLVFSNARLFNPKGHVVHDAAMKLQDEFEMDYAKYQAKMLANAKRRDEHTCPHCLANVCMLCQEKCINFEPPFVMCVGPCKQRIKRHAIYYKTHDGQNHWCLKCYGTLPKKLRLSTNSTFIKERMNEIQQDEKDNVISKTDLVKAKFLDELTEPWVQCDHCCRWVHQICALFNSGENGNALNAMEDAKYKCPTCRLLELNKRNKINYEKEVTPVPQSEVSQSKSLSLQLTPTGIPGATNSPQVVSPVDKKATKLDDSSLNDINFTTRALYIADMEADKEASSKGLMKSPTINIGSSNLKSCQLSRYMEKRVSALLVSLNEQATADSISIKVVSNIQTTCKISPIIQEYFKRNSEKYPELLSYTSKAIFVFQKLDGVEVCIFSMYVQEYDGSCSIISNRYRTYIAYIDSLVYMQPCHVRTDLFHELLISYLAYCKLHCDFQYAHIWACPTTRGGDFIYWCHPHFQKNPGKDRLVAWYLKMIDKARNANVVFACEDLFCNEFKYLDASKTENDTDLNACRLPPYFDGDYWPAEFERIVNNPPKRGKNGATTQEDEASKIARFRKKLVDSVKFNRDALFVLSLQPKCHSCGIVMVNSQYWKSSKGDGKFLCTSCFPAIGINSNEWISYDLKEDKDLITLEEKDDNDLHLSCPFLDHRPDMLKNCEERHFQFDTLRRAKYSTMMLVYEIYRAQQNERRM